MPDFYAAADFQLTLSVRRQITGNHVANIENMIRLFQITPEIDADEVIILFVGATHEITHGPYGTVCDNRKRQSGWADKPGKTTCFGANFFFAGKPEIGKKRNLSNFCLVEMMIATQQQKMH